MAIASAYTAQVQIAGKPRWYRGYIEVTSQQNLNDEWTRLSITARLEDHSAALYGVHYDVLADGQITASKNVVLNNYGYYWATRDTTTTIADILRTGAARTVSVQIHAYGYYNGTNGNPRGDVWATVNVSIPQRGYSEPPYPPKNPKLENISDTSQKISWEANYTDMRGAYPWSYVHIYRAEDDGAPVDIKYVTWDILNYTDNSTEVGHKYTYTLYSYGPGGSSAPISVGTVFTTPLAPKSIQASKTDASTIELLVTCGSGYDSGYEFERSVNGQAFESVSLEEAGIAFAGAGASSKQRLFQDTSAPAGTVVYRARQVKDEMRSGWTKSTELVTITPPLSPKVKAPALAEAGKPIVVSWVPNHPDGSVQQKAEIKITNTEDNSHKEYTLEGDALSYEVDGLDAGNWRVQVRTKGVHESWGAYSVPVALVVAYPPQVYITSPATDQYTADRLPLEVSFEMSDDTGITSAILTLMGADGATVLSRSVKGATRASFSGYEYIKNNSSYELVLEVRGGSSLVSKATRRFTTNWKEPVTPQASYQVDDACAASVTVNNGAPTADEPLCEAFSLVRVFNGTSHTLASGILAGTTVYDALASINTDYRYLVIGKAASGSTSSFELPAYVESPQMVLNFGKGAEKVFKCGYNASYSTSAKRQAETYHFANGATAGGLPSTYALDERDESTSLSFDIKRGAHDEFRRIMSEEHIGWWRGFAGERAYGYMTFSESLKASGIWSASVDITHNVFEEPQNG